MSRTRTRFTSLSSMIRISSLAILMPRSSRSLNCWLYGRQSEKERRALARHARQPDSSTVQLDELSGQRKAQTCALSLTLRVRADLAEFVEHRLAILRRNADSGVGDADFDHAIDQARPNADLSAFRSELHGVREQVQHDLLELALVSMNFVYSRVDHVIQGQSMLRRALLDQGERIIDRHRHTEG